MSELSTALERSAAFLEELMVRIASAENFGGVDGRQEAAIAAAEVAIEHGVSLNALFELGMGNSAVALLRLEYEALLRSAWLLYAATDLQVEKASAPLTRESADAAKNLPNAEAMLVALEREAKAEPGLHPLARARDGFPEELAVSVVKLSNGLIHFAARLLSRFTDDRGVMREVDEAYRQFQDVMPMVREGRG